MTIRENGLTSIDELFDFRLDLDTDDELESEVEVVDDMELEGFDEDDEDDRLEKGGKVHRYETRIPTGNPRRPWRYIYARPSGKRKEAHGRVEHLVAGAKIKGRHNNKEGHWHVEKATKHHVHITHSHTGHTVKMKKTDAAAMLAKHPATQARSDRAKAAHAARKMAKGGKVADPLFMLRQWADRVQRQSGGSGSKLEKGDASSLHTLLSLLIQARDLAQRCHWNVTGPTFPQLHRLFAEEYQGFGVFVDEVAERIRQKNGSVDFNADPTPDRPVLRRPNEMVGELARARETLLGWCETALRGMSDDAPTTDLLTRHAAEHAKRAWMLKSTEQPA